VVSDRAGRPSLVLSLAGGHGHGAAPGHGARSSQLAVVASPDWRRGGRLRARGSQSPSLGAGSDPCRFRASVGEAENGSVASCLGKGDVQGTMLFAFEDEAAVHRV
jgi:hypothetical protein